MMARRPGDLARADALPTVGDTIWVGAPSPCRRARRSGRRTGTRRTRSSGSARRAVARARGLGRDRAIRSSSGGPGRSPSTSPARCCWAPAGGSTRCRRMPLPFGSRACFPPCPPIRRSPLSRGPTSCRGRAPARSRCWCCSLLALALLAPVHWWWRRRGRPHPRRRSRRPDCREPPLDRWADAGESRAVASVATARLRAQIATRMPAAHAGLDTEDVLRAVGGAVRLAARRAGRPAALAR